MLINFQERETEWGRIGKKRKERKKRKEFEERKRMKQKEGLTRQARGRFGGRGNEKKHVE